MTNPSEGNYDTFISKECFSRIEQQVRSALYVDKDVRAVDSNYFKVLPSGLTRARCLDKYYIVYDDRRPESREVTERALFAAIADRYNSDVDIENNVDTASFLISLVDSDNILDFGCGTGLVLRSPLASDRNILGVDASSQMVAIARQAGLRAQTTDELQPGILAEHSGIIATYVLHLQSARKTLFTLLESQEFAGRISANFHKNEGFTQTNDFLRRLGFELQLDLHETPGLASPVALWRSA